jgi:hypothetical protein
MLTASCPFCFPFLSNQRSPRYSFIHPLSYTVLFVTGDAVSLIVQAVGGGIAAGGQTLEETERGADIMVSHKHPICPSPGLGAARSSKANPRFAYDP